MLLKEDLEKIVLDQQDNILKYDKGMTREKLKEIDLNVKFATVIMGIRRSGKSTLLNQLMNSKFYYLNFEDPRLVDFKTKDFERLNEVFISTLGKTDYYFFDEIQNVEKWEIFVRWLLEKNKKVVITGSNASLLSKELGTRLTGRHIDYELFPFSYNEFLKYTKIEKNVKTYIEYLNRGGLPEYLKTNNEESFQILLNDILMRDVALRHNIKNHKILYEMIIYLFSNVSKEFTYNSLLKIFEIGSINTIISFISHFEDSYLLFTIPRFDYSLKKMIRSPKKVYCIDTGLCKNTSLSSSEDMGRILENSIFLHLRRKNKNIYYHRDEKECDFIIKEKNKITNAIQVCYDLTKDNNEREFKGLLEAMYKFSLKEGYLVTMDKEDKIKHEDKIIHIIPAWKFCSSKFI
jgi:uncharacterized protein